jgi:type VI protein secretion system component VasF
MYWYNPGREATSTRKRVPIWVITGLMWYINLCIWVFVLISQNEELQEIQYWIKTANKEFFILLLITCDISWRV